jgi:hypothetical protein
MAQKFSGQIRFQLGIICNSSLEESMGNWLIECELTEESNVVQPGGPIKQLQRNLPGDLIGTRKANNCKNTFDELAMNCCAKGNPRTENKYVYS